MSIQRVSNVKTEPTNIPEQNNPGTSNTPVVDQKTEKDTPIDKAEEEITGTDKTTGSPPGIEDTTKTFETEQPDSESTQNAYSEQLLKFLEQGSESETATTQVIVEQLLITNQFLFSLLVLHCIVAGVIVIAAVVKLVDNALFK